MKALPSPVADFLAARRIAVAGVSRHRGEAANAVFRKLKSAGYEVTPLNPQADEVEGVRCYRDVGAIPGGVDAVVIATPPAVGVDVVRQCAEHGVKHIWFHRSFGQGSVADEAVRECEARGLHHIVGGCPLMYVEPVDLGHRCMRWVLGFGGRVPR